MTADLENKHEENLNLPKSNIYGRTQGMKAIVEIPDGEPYEGRRVFPLEVPPALGHHVGDQNGNLYKIIEIVHLLDTNKTADDPYLKLIVEKKLKQ